MGYLDSVQNAPIENRFLAALPQDEYERFVPHLEEVDLTFGTTIYDRGQTIDYVYFPTGSIFSLLAVGPDDLTLEMGIVGREGMVGVPVFADDRISTFRVVVQGDGTAMRMPTADFEIECERDETLQEMMMGFVKLRLMQASLASACHRFHGVEKRLVRWILMTSDRMQNDEIPVTNVFLSHILGLEGDVVTDAVKTLEKRGLIDYSNGRFLIVDRPGLEDAACKCYAIIRNEEKRFPPAT